MDKLNILKSILNIDTNTNTNTSSQIKFNSPELTTSINLIANNSKILIALDIEFYNAKLAKTPNLVPSTSLASKEIYSMIREFGALIFYNNDSYWTYYGKIFFNAPPLVDEDKLGILQPAYTTLVDKTTINKLFQKYKSYTTTTSTTSMLDTKYTFIEDYHGDNKKKLIKYHKKILKLYLKATASRLITNNQLYKFLQFLNENKSYSSEIAILTKGRRDLDAMTNTLRLLSNNYQDNLNFAKLYDIEIYNSLSHILFHSAELSNTCRGLLDNKYFKELNLKSLNKFITKFSIKNETLAHSPVWDSACTFIVAIIVNLASYKVLKQGNYYYKYQKYKTKYTSSKK